MRYSDQGPAGMAAWDRWRNARNNRIAKPTRLKTCIKGYPHIKLVECSLPEVL